MGRRNNAVKRRTKPYEPVAKYFQLEHWIVASVEFRKLPGSALSLLLEFVLLFNGSNNGDLAMTWERLKEKRGWTCKRTFLRALRRLIADEWIIKTRQGGRNRCCLYALTFLPVDDCGNKLDAGFELEEEPSHKWAKVTKIPARNPERKSEAFYDEDRPF